MVNNGILGSFTTANEVINGLLDGVAIRIQNEWVRKNKVPFTTASTIQQCERALEIKYLKVDNRPEGEQNYLELDDEP